MLNVRLINVIMLNKIGVGVDLFEMRVILDVTDGESFLK